ncbi:unnamed protein product [Haemonchus placei]|uniref:Ground-like domain-containing protein n=1 Tax=Haemonchus placei TaxID=6290 RepID=A0A0N4VXW7_HAEPC|nr:unnamed protein product [Haemonchus placei]
MKRGTDEYSLVFFKSKHLLGTANDDNTDKLTNCNDPKLKQIILENIQKDAPTSKRAIQKAAELEFGGTFDVVCSPCEFSFVISSQKYCDGIKDEVPKLEDSGNGVDNLVPTRGNAVWVMVHYII